MGVGWKGSLEIECIKQHLIVLVAVITNGCFKNCQWYILYFCLKEEYILIEVFFAVAWVCGSIIPSCSFLLKSYLAFLPLWAHRSHRGGWDPRIAAVFFADLFRMLLLYYTHSVLLYWMQLTQILYINMVNICQICPSQKIFYACHPAWCLKIFLFLVLWYSDNMWRRQAAG